MMRPRVGTEEVSMSFETKLLAAAREATGDDTIHDVADFQPKGSAGSSSS
jgi:hypothetical protein